MVLDNDHDETDMELHADVDLMFDDFHKCFFLKPRGEVIGSVVGEW